MQIVTLGGLFLDPRFIFIFLTIILVIINILIGVSMLPKDIRKRRFKVHRFTYYSIVVCYCIFLWISYSSSITGWLQYCILVYFLLYYLSYIVVCIRMHMSVECPHLLGCVGTLSFLFLSCIG